MAVTRTSYVDVLFWLPRDGDNYITTSVEGQKDYEYQNARAARCGHVAMKMVHRGDEYVSFWPGRFNTEEADIDPTEHPYNGESIVTGEGTLPDVIVRLHNLNVPAMLAAFAKARKRCDNQKLTWAFESPITTDITDTETTTANCSTFVYSLLLKGGFSSRSSVYYNAIRRGGPQDHDFCSITRCDINQLFGGLFNKAFWTDWKVTPTATLLRVASAAEACEEDMRATEVIMKSTRVVKEIRERPGRTSLGATAVILSSVAAFLAFRALRKT